MAIENEAEERTQRAERRVGFVRVGIVSLNTLYYFFALDRSLAVEWLAITTIVGALSYAFYVAIFEPYRKYPVLTSSFFTTVTDGALITLWLLATGGLASPYYVLWYVSLAAVAYRFDGRSTWISASVYAASYVAVGLIARDIALHATELGLRIAYIVFAAAILAAMARESQSEISQRLVMRDEVQEARTAEAKFRGLLEAAPDPIVILDSQGRIALVNSQAERTFGHSRAEMLGKPVHLLLPEAPRAAHPWLRDPHSATPTHDVSRDFNARRKDGSTFPVEISLSPMETDEGTLVTSIIHDITDRVRAEEERLTSMDRLREVERLRELDRFKTAFINTAAHELGTPLTPIKLQLHILKTATDGALNERQMRAVTILDRNVDRLHHLVQEVLKVARLQAGRLGITLEPVDLNQIVLEAVESFQEPARESGLRLELRTTPGLRVDADPKRITQVIFNLLNNAWKFTPRDGRIIVETGLLNDMAVVRVLDSGSGMKREDIEKLFQPFSQVHDTMQKTVGGTGLGLYISKGIVDLHKGRIWAESPGPGLGSTFSFAIPLRTTATMPAVQPEEPAAIEAPVAKGSKDADNIARRARELV